MKFTVKISPHESISIEPNGEHLKLTFKTPVFSFDRTLNVDQAAAIGFGFEQALDVAMIRRDAAQNQTQAPM